MYKLQSPGRAWLSRVTMALTILLSVALIIPSASPAVAAQGEMAEAIVLVNSHSASSLDFDHYIQPYLDHFGVPYTIHDIGTQAVPANIGDYALIMIGHRELDVSNTYLDATEEGYISGAVTAGSGLVNFDNRLADGTTPLYGYVNSLFGFSYQAPVVDYGVSFPILSGTLGTTIDCTADANQDPVLPTNPTDHEVSLIDVTDNAWTEMTLYPRLLPAVMAGIDENLPVMRCFETGLPNGDYQVIANLYTGSFGEDLTYYYGYSAADPMQSSIDTTGRSGGEDQFGEYTLGTVTISDGTFNIYYQDANARPVAATAAGRAALEALYARDPYARLADPAYFGWSSIRLVPVGTPAPEMHWISALHDPGDWIGTGSMTMAGIASMPLQAKVVADSRLEPLVVAISTGQGRAVQWGSYDWMLYSVKGPMYGLDDLVWRSLVWAARKPFVMQGLPPFVTMRVTEAEGPFGWITTANAEGFKPWTGVFYELVGPSATELAMLANDGMATVGVYARNRNVTTTGGFYYDHDGGELTDGTFAGYFAAASSWYDNNNIPISSYALPVFYEFGTNVFEELETWGVDTVGTVITPGLQYPPPPAPVPWLNDLPFRRYQDGNANSSDPLYYADWLAIPGDPALAEPIFNCITEIRDDATYEWRPNNDVMGSVGRGTRQLQRALNAMAVASLNTSEPALELLVAGNLTDILQGINANLAAYDPMYVTMDYACHYARAMFTSDIVGAPYNPATGELLVNLEAVNSAAGTNMPTSFYLFTEQGGTIQQRMVDVPPFTGSTQVPVQLGPTQTLYFYLPLVTRNWSQP